MNQNALNRCKNITKEVMEQPLNGYFRKIKLEELPHYEDIIEKPIDFERIRTNLNDGVYKTPAQWYNDMILVYSNAMTYHPEEVIWHKIAKYCLMSFKNKAHESQTGDMQSWYKEMNNRLYKLTEKIAQSPIPQVIDPIVTSSIKKAESLPPPSNSSIFELVTKINKLAEKEDCKKEIICILNKTQPDLVINGEEFQIDADKLSNIALNSLNLYSNTRG